MRRRFAIKDTEILKGLYVEYMDLTKSINEYVLGRNKKFSSIHLNRRCNDLESRLEVELLSLMLENINRIQRRYMLVDWSKVFTNYLQHLSTINAARTYLENINSEINVSLETRQHVLAISDVLHIFNTSLPVLRTKLLHCILAAIGVVIGIVSSVLSYIFIKK